MERPAKEQDNDQMVENIQKKCPHCRRRQPASAFFSRGQYRDSCTSCSELLTHRYARGKFSSSGQERGSNRSTRRANGQEQLLDSNIQNLYTYQECRRQILQIQQTCAYQLQTIFRSLRTGAKILTQQVLEKLTLLFEVERQCRLRLYEAPFETEVIVNVDKLLTSPVKTPKEIISRHWDRLDAEGLVLNSFAETNPPQLCSGSPPVHKSKPPTDGDAGLSELLSRTIDGINTRQFRYNLRSLLRIQQRLSFIAKRTAAKGRNRASKMEALFQHPLQVLHDNMLHATRLFAMLKEELPEKYTEEIADRTWVRIVAILALCHGCTSEPALFLTAIDRLLNDLRTVGGEDMRGHRYEVLLAELSLFVHGCVVSCVLDTNSKTSLLPKSGSARGTMDNMRRLNNTCHVCGEEMNDRENISVGMRDIRVGNSAIRSTISENRADAYVCFGVAMGRKHWLEYWSSPSAGPFFFYFAELYHPKCRVFREKETRLG